MAGLPSVARNPDVIKAPSDQKALLLKSTTEGTIFP